MENPESEGLQLGLELLPLEVITVIASYLKARDVVQCCATSSTMREMFSDNSIWRSRCKREVAENLKKTPSKITPSFVTPEMNDTSLSPLPEWRVSYMRENHLWNNWRRGMFSEEYIKQRHSRAVFHFFYNNDCVVAKYDDKIEFLDVTVFPASDICTLALENVHFGTKERSHLKIECANDMVVFLLRSGVQVFGLDLNLRVCQLQHTFFFEDSLALKDSESHEEKSISNRPTHKFEEKHVIVGNYFVGVLEGESTMHIWNLETGHKLKKELCILKNSPVISIQASDTMHVILKVGNVNTETNNTLLAYSLQRMKYLPFKEALDRISQYCVHKQFVVIECKNDFQIFNYQTSKIIATVPTDTFPKAIKNNLLFVKNGDIQVFNLTTNTTHSLGLKSVADFEVLGDKFIQVRRSGTIWELDETCQHIKTIHMKFSFDCCGFFLNKAYTRYIVRYGVGYILNFW